MGLLAQALVKHLDLCLHLSKTSGVAASANADIAYLIRAFHDLQLLINYNIDPEVCLHRCVKMLIRQQHSLRRLSIACGLCCCPQSMTVCSS